MLLKYDFLIIWFTNYHLRCWTLSYCLTSSLIKRTILKTVKLIKQKALVTTDGNAISKVMLWSLHAAQFGRKMSQYLKKIMIVTGIVAIAGMLIFYSYRFDLPYQLAKNINDVVNINTSLSLLPTTYRFSKLEQLVDFTSSMKANGSSKSFLNKSVENVELPPILTSNFTSIHYCRNFYEAKSTLGNLTEVSYLLF